MAFNSSQNKDYDITGFGGIFDAFPTSYSFDGYSQGPTDINSYTFDDTINQCLSLQNEEDDGCNIQKTLFLNNKFISNDPPTLTADDSTTTSSNNDKSITSDITPLSNNTPSFFPFPSNNKNKNSNTSPGSTASTTSNGIPNSINCIQMQPKIEGINMNEINANTTVNTTVNTMNENNLWFNNFNSTYINNYNIKPEITVPANKEHRDAILREFMNGYNQTKSNNNNNNN
eukprot:483913_1